MRQFSENKRPPALPDSVAPLKSGDSPINHTFSTAEHPLPEELSHDDVKWLRLVADNVPVNIAYLDTEHRYRYVNGNVERHYGLRQEEIIGKHAIEVLGEGPYRRFLPHIEDALRGEEVTFEQELASFDGRHHNYQCTYRPHFSDHNETAGFFIILVDITDRKRAEREAQEAQVLVQEAIDALSEGFLLFDADERLVLANAPYRIYYEKIQERLVPGIKFEDWARIVAESGMVVGAIGRVDEWVAQRLRDFRNLSGLHEYEFSDGRWIQTREYKTPSGGTAGLRVDITNQKQAEQALVESRDQLSSVTDNLPVLITYVDAEQRYRFANKTSAEWFAQPVEEVVGRTVSEIFGQEFEKIRTGVDSSLAGEQLTYVDSVTYPDGVARTVRATHIPHFGAAGNVEGYFSLVEDITEAHHVERALRESEERLRTIADNSTSVILLKDTDGRYTFANRAWHDTYNPKGVDIVGKTVRDFMTPEVADHATATDGKVLETGEAVIEEQILPTADGEWQNILAVKFPVRDEVGNIVALGGINTNITERVRAEEKMRESEAMFRAVFENAGLGMAVLDRDGVFLDVNDAMAKMFSDTVDGLTGESIDSMTVPDELDRSMEQFNALLKKERDTANFEKRYRRKGGEPFEAHVVSSVVFDRDGEFKFTIGLVEDITERKKSEQALRESEERLRALIDNLPNGITLKNTHGQFIHVNERAAEIFGLPENDVLGRMSAEILTREQLADFATADNDILAGRSEKFSDTLRVSQLDGQEHIYNLTKFPVFDADARPAGVGTISTDITDAKRTEEMLRQAQKMEAVGQLTGGVAHDFNNLLAVVIGNLEMVTDHFANTSQLDTPVFEHVRSAFTAAERGASLTHHLLAFSRQQVLRPEETNLSDLIVKTNELMSVSMGENITVNLCCDDGLWLCKVDQVQLQNAILNLSINARDAMKARGELTIRAENVRFDAERAEALELDEGDYVCLSVSDTGPGIPEDVIEHVYEPFFTTKDVGEGSGLGLSMVYGFAQQSGGGVDIETEVGEGTTMQLYFPAIVSATVTTIEDAAQPQADLSEPDATILLVEDNPAFRKITREILENLNFQVIDFGTVEEALSVIGGTTPFDLLLSDVGLPGDKNGHDLARIAASARPGLKIILMSAHADLQFNGRIIDDNIAAFLPKPHRKAELAQTLRRVLGVDTSAT